jgi:lipoprotein-anchoring transpeptidase ErfK/SrfK
MGANFYENSNFGIFLVFSGGRFNSRRSGAAGSQGRIRLHNGDVILVYNLLTPGLSQVEVVE